MLAGSAVVAVCAHVVLPLTFTPVPLTLQTFAVLLLSLLFSPRLAAGTMAAYLAEGALGLPVFSPVPVMAGGLAHLLGPTGGYLLAYPAAAAVISSMWRRTRRRPGRRQLEAPLWAHFDSGLRRAVACAADARVGGFDFAARRASVLAR